ncbi:MAG TPA: MarR family transcriptional regulator [Polyangiaceae bacterium]|nr:MarR family transcriptional regulator [Polyangiaceae bacterium]
MATRIGEEKLFGEVQRDEDRRWRAERRAREARRKTVERSWRERPESTRGLRATDVRKAEWRRAMRWRRQIQSVCGASGLTFTQWLILDSVRDLISETGDAVIQEEIAARLELDPATICEVMQRLEAKALVSRGADITCKAWRVFLTGRAEQLLRDIDARIEAASKAER